MTLVQLRHLQSIAQTGSFKRSAETLGLTQPALSRSIAMLEEEFGQLLFDRVGRRVELTTFGQALMGRVSNLLYDADEFVAAFGRLRGVRIGMSSTPAQLLAGRLLKAFAERSDRVRIQIRRGDSALLFEYLRERKIDALVTDARVLPPSVDLRVVHAFDLEAAFLVRPGHPLAAGSAPISFARMCAYPLAAGPLNDTIEHALIEKYGVDAHPSRSVKIASHDVSTLIDAADQSDMVLLGVAAAAPRLVPLRLDPPLVARGYYVVVTLADHIDPPALEFAIEQIRGWYPRGGVSPS